MLPKEIFLRALPLKLEVCREEESSVPPKTVRLFDHRPAANRLTLMHSPVSAGTAAERTICSLAVEALLSAIRREAETALPALVIDTARKIGAPVPPRVRIAFQRTRWASRSSTGTVSCNALMLFLPRDLVVHIVLHELAHIAHMDHGPGFHALLARLDPLGAVHEKSLKTASINYLPAVLR